MIHDIFDAIVSEAFAGEVFKNMNSLLAIIALSGCFLMVQGHNLAVSDKFIRDINTIRSTWRVQFKIILINRILYKEKYIISFLQAGRNFHPNVTETYLKRLMGVHPNASQHLAPYKVNIYF